jgi:hypothetical protein
MTEETSSKVSSAWRTLTIAMFVIVGVGIAAYAALLSHSRGREVARIVHPTGGASYTIRYAQNGDLSFTSADGRLTASFGDYYGSLEIAEVTWTGDREVQLRFAGGGRSGARISVGGNCTIDYE